MTESSTALPLPFLLSLRRSRMPIAERFLTPGLRNNPPKESLRGWAEPPAVAVIAISAPDGLFRSMLPVSICRDDGPCERSREGGARPFVPSSSLQSAGVGGTVSRLVPVPGGPLNRKGNVIPEDESSIGRFRLCERGGGPGGGGGRGMLGSQVTGLGV